MNAALREMATAPGETIYPGEWDKAVKLLAEGKDINYEGASGSQEFDEGRRCAGRHHRDGHRRQGLQGNRPGELTGLTGPAIKREGPELASGLFLFV